MNKIFYFAWSSTKQVLGVAEKKVPSKGGISVRTSGVVSGVVLFKNFNTIICGALLLMLAGCGGGGGTAPPSYTVTPTAGSNGSIAPATAQTVSQGAIISYAVSPHTGYGISSVTGCNGILSGSSYITGPITGDCTVTANFTPFIYTVTPSTGTGGSIAPTTAQTVNYGSATSFTLTPDTGYSIGSVSGCGGTLSGNTYTTGSITGDCTLNAAFTHVSYTVTPSVGSGGTISPAMAQTIGHGGSTSFTLTPDNGYSIGSVSGCGGMLSGNTYTTGPVTGNCTVSATFTRASYTVTPSAGSGGSITPATAQAVGYGGNTSFAVTPNSGYRIVSVSGCGGTLSGSSYTTGPVTGNCSVAAVFESTTGSLHVDW